MPRLFVALNLPDAIKQQVAPLLHIPLSEAKPVKRENLHMTLKFIGDVVDSLQSDIEVALATVKSQPLVLHLHQVTCVPYPPKAGKTRLIWVTIGGDVRPLQQLAQQIEKALTPLGILPEKRAFNPHLTLSRFRQAPSVDAITSYLEQHAHFKTGSFTCDHIALYCSILKPEGAVYRVETVYPLQGR